MRGRTRHRHACPHGISTTCTGADMHVALGRTRRRPLPFSVGLAGFSTGDAEVGFVLAHFRRRPAGLGRSPSRLDSSPATPRGSLRGSAAVSARPRRGRVRSGRRLLVGRGQVARLELPVIDAPALAPRSSSSKSSAAAAPRSHPKNPRRREPRGPPTTNAAAIFIRFAVVTEFAPLPTRSRRVPRTPPHARPSARVPALQKSSDAHVSAAGLAFGDTHALQHEGSAPPYPPTSPRSSFERPTRLLCGSSVPPHPTAYRVCRVHSHRSVAIAARRRATARAAARAPVGCSTGPARAARVRAHVLGGPAKRSAGHDGVVRGDSGADRGAGRAPGARSGPPPRRPRRRPR